MSELELKGKTGIVTGASSGIGFQIANVLAEAGAAVYAISRTGAPKEGVGESSPGVIHVKGDIGDQAAMKTLLDEITASTGGVLDFLVNNAGATFKCRAEEFPEDQFDHIMDVNVKYVFEMSRLCYPFLKNQHHQHECPSGLFRGCSLLYQQGSSPCHDTRSGGRMGRR